MKRIIYISKLSLGVSQHEIQKISEISHLNNQKRQVTGVLLYLGGFFFQVIEGELEDVEALYHKILADDRHTDILCLKTEYNVTERLYPNWAMKTINLEETTDIVIQPIKTLLQTVTESHRILEKYTQPSVINILKQGQNPLHVEPRIIEKIIFFSDICSFSAFAEKLSITEVIQVVNQYLEICSKHIVEFGGEINKFIGDSVMASFSCDMGDNVIECCVTILQALQELRDQAEGTSPMRVLHTGIGLSCGKVIEGNMGSLVKMDYTLLGDEVNIAARLESLTRTQPYALIFSQAVKNHTQKNWPFVNLGQHKVKGKQKGVNLFSIQQPHVRKTLNTSELVRLIHQTLDKA